MTIEELKGHCIRQITEFERIKEITPVTPNDYKRYEEHKMVLRLIEAWEKVKEEIKDLDLGFVDEEYQAGVAYGIMKITETIDRHLKGIENVEVSE